MLGTGYHAAAAGGVNEATTVTVVGDGAVGLLAVLSAKRLGAEQIILMGRHQDRTDLGAEFGATDVVAERGEEGITKVRELARQGLRRHHRPRRLPRHGRPRRAQGPHPALITSVTFGAWSPLPSLFLSVRSLNPATPSAYCLTHLARSPMPLATRPQGSLCHPSQGAG